jgi:hypothetical protein
MARHVGMNYFLFIRTQIFKNEWQNRAMSVIFTVVPHSFFSLLCIHHIHSLFRQYFKINQTPPPVFMAWCFIN